MKLKYRCSKCEKSGKLCNDCEFDYKKEHDGWDVIFYEIENSLHSDLPNRVKNWLRNKFYSPVKK